MWRDAQLASHRRFWPDLDRLLSGLPPNLARRAKLLEYDLALRHSESGRFEDIFLGADQLPILSVGSWLLDDLGVPPGAQREPLEGSLFVAGVLAAMRILAAESIADAESFSDEGYVPVVQLLADRSLRLLADVVPRDAPFWSQRDAVVLTHLERALARHEPRVRDDPDAHLPGPWAAPLTEISLAAASAATRADVAAAIPGLVDQVAAGFQIQADVASLHRDLLAGRPSHAIAVIARAAGVPLRPWPDANVVLGAMIATRSLPAILEQARSCIVTARRTAIDLQLPTLAAYLTDVEAGFAVRTPSAAAPRRGPPSRRPIVETAVPALRHAIGMAEAYLRSDATLRESWEIHREGMFGAPEVVSRFPAGLVLEILGRHGHDISTQADEFVAYADANHYRYYDHPACDPDTDTIGVCLRLQRWASAVPERTAALDSTLGCLEREVERARAVPVWLTGCGAGAERPAVVALGEGCGTVAAHLLLGLVGAGTGDAVIGVGADWLLDRIAAVGLRANVNYPPSYALAVFSRLVRRLDLDARGQPARLADARRVLSREVELAAVRASASAQDAALLITACHEAARPELARDGWLTTILEQQRFDGSWIGEPFAATPNRGGRVSWYSSATLTTALCYDALRRSARRRAA